MLMFIIRAFLIKKMEEMSYLEREGTMEIMAQAMHTLVYLDISHLEKQKQ